MRFCQGLPKSSSKRGADALDAPEHRPHKKKRTASTSEDDMDWLKHEIADIKECIRGLAEHLREDTDRRLDELLQYVQN